MVVGCTYQVVNCPEEDSELMSAFISALDGDTFSLWSRLNGLAGRQTDRQTGSSADEEGILLCKTNIPVVNNVWSFVMWRRDKFAVGEVFVRSNG